MNTEIYVQYGQAGSPMRTERAEAKIDELYHHKAGLTYTATGLGDKIPTKYKAFVQGSWRRVYSRRYGNVSSEYIHIRGERVYVTLYNY